MDKEIRVSASLLGADFKNIDNEIRKAIDGGVDWLHLDVMDGHFVNNISFGFPILEAVMDYPIFKDVHIMISDPLKYVDRLINVGADLITFHYEACNKSQIKELIKKIHEYDVAVGISIKPDTNPEVLLPYLKDIDLVLVMSVEPGFGGQKYLDSATEKIKYLDNIIKEKEYECLIEVDGGINETTSKIAKEAGVDVLVTGKYIFASDDVKNSVKILKGTL